MAQLPWMERWYDLRDRLTASRAFQRWAAAFPLTRPIARRRARELFELVAGFVHSQVLAACVKLRLFDLLAAGPMSSADISRRIGLPLDRTERLLAAAIALRLVQPRGKDRFGLGVLGAPMVGNTGIAAMVEHHDALYFDLRDPLALLQGQSTDRALAGYWPYAEHKGLDALPAERVRAYSALMSASQPLVGDEVVASYDLSRHRCLLDVGGGDGTFLSIVAKAAPDLRLHLFDLPQVASVARQRLLAEGLATRCNVSGGSFFDDALPKGADVASLVRVIFDHPDERALQILKAVHAALPVGGTLLLAEPMAAADGTSGSSDAYFDFYLMAMGRGRLRSPQALMQLLSQAGFDNARVVPTHMPLNTGLILAQATAVKPAGYLGKNPNREV